MTTPRPPPELAGRLGCPVRAVDEGFRVGGLGLVDGDVLDAAGCTVEVVATPGHTADSVCLLVRDADGARLLTGDTVLGAGTSVIMHPDGHLGSYLDSLRKLSDLVTREDVQELLPGHGPVVDDPAAWLEFYRRHREERLEQVRAALADGDKTAAEVVSRVYTDVDRAVWPAAERSVAAQLQFLAETARSHLIEIAQGAHRLRHELLSLMSDQSGLNTPPFGGQHFGTPAGPSYSPQGVPGCLAGLPVRPAAELRRPGGLRPRRNRRGPHARPGLQPRRLPGSGRGTTLQPAPAAPKQRTRLGAVIVAAALSAVIGVGAGIGSYAYFSGGGSVASPISVTTQQAADSPKLDGTIAAAAAKIEPSVVTITVQSGNSGDIGSGVVLDNDGHILTNNHVVEAAKQSGTITVTFHDGTHRARRRSSGPPRPTTSP